jgi:hypothetical protein
MPWKFREETKDKGIFLSRFDDIVLIVAVKLQLSILEPIGVDLGCIFEQKLQVDCRIADISNLDFPAFDVGQLYIEAKLQAIDD